MCTANGTRWLLPNWLATFWACVSRPLNWCRIRCSPERTRCSMSRVWTHQFYEPGGNHYPILVVRKRNWAIKPSIQLNLIKNEFYKNEHVNLVEQKWQWSEFEWVQVHCRSDGTPYIRTIFRHSKCVMYMYVKNEQMTLMATQRDARTISESK